MREVSSRNAALESDLARICRKRAPPLRQADARSTGVHPARAATSTSTMAFSGLDNIVNAGSMMAHSLMLSA